MLAIGLPGIGTPLTITAPNRISGRSVIMAATVDVSEPNACTIHLAAVGGGLVKSGYSVRLLVPQPADDKPPALDFADLGVALEQTPLGRKFGLPNTFGFLLMIPSLLRAARAVRQTGEQPLFYIRFSPLSFVVMAVLKLFAGHPTIISEHNGWIQDEALAGGWPRWLARLAGLSQKLDSLLADAVRVVSSEIAQVLERNGVRGAKLFVAENACDTERLHPIDRAEALNRVGLDPSRTYMGFLGNLTIWQGVALGLDGFALLKDRFPTLDFIVGGAGPEFDNLKAQAQRLGIADRVHFLGWVRIDRSNDVLNCLDLALCPFPGTRPMGSPVKLRDYAAAGRCILASRFQAIVKVADEDWVAFHRCDDAVDLAEQAAGLIEDPTRRTRLASAARLIAEQQFSWDAVIADIVHHIPA